MKLRERKEPLDRGSERELDAVDRALAGREVDPDLAAWGELARMLAAERPDPEPEWAENLDRRARRRFPRAEGDGPLGGVAARLSGVRPMRLLAPAGALATLLVAIVVAGSTLGGESGGGASLETAGDGGGGAVVPTSGGSGDSAGSAAPAAPEILEDANSAAQASDALRAQGGDTGDLYDRSASKIAPGTERRQIERDVRMELSTQPEQVREVSDEVIAITRSLDGIVASSQVTEAGQGSSATLSLTLPTRNLDTAIDQLTELANVESLNEATLDITKPYVSAQDRLRDARAERRRLLDALAGAATEAEAEALQERIDEARREISRAESAFEKIARRSRLADVSVTVTGDPNAKDDRSLTDWLDDAGAVLRDVLGVLLVTAAIVVPLAILIVAIWFGVSRLRRMRRERALGA